LHEEFPGRGIVTFNVREEGGGNAERRERGERKEWKRGISPVRVRDHAGNAVPRDETSFVANHSFGDKNEERKAMSKREG